MSISENPIPVSACAGRITFVVRADDQAITVSLSPELARAFCESVRVAVFQAEQHVHGPRHPSTVDNKCPTCNYKLAEIGSPWIDLQHCFEISPHRLEPHSWWCRMCGTLSTPVGTGVPSWVRNDRIAYRGLQQVAYADDNGEDPAQIARKILQECWDESIEGGKMPGVPT